MVSLPILAVSSSGNCTVGRLYCNRQGKLTFQNDTSGLILTSWIHLYPHSQAVGEWPGNFYEFKLLLCYQKVGSTNQISCVT